MAVINCTYLRLCYPFNECLQGMDPTWAARHSQYDWNSYSMRFIRDLSDQCGDQKVRWLYLRKNLKDSSLLTLRLSLLYIVIHYECRDGWSGSAQCAGCSGPIRQTNMSLDHLIREIAKHSIQVRQVAFCQMDRSECCGELCRYVNETHALHSIQMCVLRLHHYLYR